MDKYTVQFYQNGNKIMKDNVFLFDVKSGELAELVCKLLNENDARKNQPRIDKDFKKELIKYMEEYYSSHCIHLIDNGIKKVNEAIEILSNLPSEEN